mmetsp:Transcript_22230/g.63610  ORF Transcript_22230/g.63610 Transcript_22230/m.63610 type:complete len:243 (+) Transcript_22230:712-1440(+)
MVRDTSSVHLVYCTYNVYEQGPRLLVRKSIMENVVECVGRLFHHDVHILSGFDLSGMHRAEIGDEARQVAQRPHDVNFLFSVPRPFLCRRNYVLEHEVSRVPSRELHPIHYAGGATADLFQTAQLPCKIAGKPWQILHLGVRFGCRGVIRAGNWHGSIIDVPRARWQKLPASSLRPGGFLWKGQAACSCGGFQQWPLRLRCFPGASSRSEASDAKEDSEKRQVEKIPNHRGERTGCALIMRD